MNLLRKSFKSSLLTSLPSKRNNISSTLAHHLGDVEGTVGLIGDGDGAIDSLSLHLQTQEERFISSLVSVLPAEDVEKPVLHLTSSGRLST